MAALSMQPMLRQGQERTFTKVDGGGKRERRDYITTFHMIL
jgi:hypothetical protein